MTIANADCPRQLAAVAFAPPASMARRVAALRAAGTPTEFRQYPNVGHGFVRTPTHGDAKP
ncbi:hypothetical protein F0U59_25350 [Archangium gephyra]|nr:hypothetical protein F0U59_25350 [Archangium gephyra]